MKKRTICAFVAPVVMTMAAVASGATARVTFVNLPYAEGRLYVSVTQDDKQLLAKAVEVDSGTVTVAFDSIPAGDAMIMMQAFQDLNGNGNLDFDGYGRPVEPCVRTSMPVASDGYYQVELKQY